MTENTVKDVVSSVDIKITPPTRQNTEKDILQESEKPLIVNQEPKPSCLIFSFTIVNKGISSLALVSISSDGITSPYASSLLRIPEILYNKHYLISEANST